MAYLDDLITGLTPQNGRAFDDLNAMLERLRNTKVEAGGDGGDLSAGFGMNVQDMPKPVEKRMPDAEAPSTSGWKAGLEPSQRLETQEPKNFTVPQTAPLVQTPRQAQAQAQPMAQPRPQSALPQTQQIPQAPEPDFLDRVSALARGYNTGGLIGGLADAFGSGLNRQTEAMNLTGKALVEAGVAPNVVAAAMRQPDLMKQLIASRFGNKTAPTYGVIGENAMGQKQYGWTNPSTMQVIPGDAGGNSGANQPPQIDPYVSGEDFLKQLPPSVQTQVKAIVEGRLRPPPMGRKNPYWEQLLQYAGQYEPGFDMTRFASRQATRTDFDKGKSAGNIKALNTVMGHLDSLDQSIDGLGNFKYGGTGVNKIKDLYRNYTGDETYQRAAAKFKLAKSAVASELMKVFRETGGSVTEVKDWEEKIDENESPAALKETIQSALELIGSRMNAVNDQWNRAMNTDRDPREILSPSARGIYERIKGGNKEKAPEAPAAKPQLNLRGVPDQPPPGAITDANGKVTIANPNFKANEPESANNPRRLRWVP